MEKEFNQTHQFLNQFGSVHTLKLNPFFVRSQWQLAKGTY
jgi:hypothetical protein